MTTRTSVLKRLVAGVGVFALATAGLLASGTASADEGDTTPTKGSLTIQKRVQKEGATPANPGTEPVVGVEFTVTEVLYNSNSITLVTAQDWQRAEAVFAEDAPTLPAGPYALDTANARSAETGDPSGNAVFNNLPVGVYLVTETDPGDNFISVPAEPFWVAIPMPVEGTDGTVTYNYNPVALPKNVLDDFTVEKQAVDGVAGTELVEGTEVDWDVTLNIPASHFAFETLTITDAVPSNLQYVGWKNLVLTSGGSPTPLVVGTHYTVDAAGVVTFTSGGIAAINEGRSSAQTITAVITTKVLEVGSHENKVSATLDHSTEDDTSKTNWGALNIKKVSSDGNTPLGGAVFELHIQADDAQTCADGTVIGTKTTAAGTGAASWEFFIGNDDVDTMTVCLKEVAAPAGHVLPADAWVVGPHTVDANDASTFTWADDIVNHKPTGPQLPQTGAQGTWAMTVGGFLLIAGAATTLIVRRRKATH